MGWVWLAWDWFSAHWFRVVVLLSAFEVVMTLSTISFRLLMIHTRLDEIQTLLQAKDVE